MPTMVLRVTAKMASSSITVPQISHADMQDFFHAHFSQLATDHFQAHFLGPLRPDQETTNIEAGDDHLDYEEGDEEDDDGLGYYPDGVKRTLTDEQIAIFRHSELESLRRAKEQSSSRPQQTTQTLIEDDAARDLSEGEVSTPSNAAAANAAKKKKKKKRRHPKANNRGGGGEEGEPVDLRKRTWDVVDTGLASLDYGEQENSNGMSAPAMQRRHISYDD